MFYFNFVIIWFVIQLITTTMANIKMIELILFEIFNSTFIILERMMFCNNSLNFIKTWLKECKMDFIADTNRYEWFYILTIHVWWCHTANGNIMYQKSPKTVHVGCIMKVIFCLDHFYRPGKIYLSHKVCFIGIKVATRWC